MSTPPSPSAETVIAARLRAVGCVFAEDEARLIIGSAATPSDLADMVERRVAGLPLEQVLGWAEFCGLRITVEPDVFVPRRRTEFLVRQAVGLVRRRKAAPDRAAGPPVTVDLCCGSGAVGAALAALLEPHLGRVELHATDIDPVAAHCARRNLEQWAGQVHEGDLYKPLPASIRGRIDVLTANAPYVPSSAVGMMPPEARLHEPLAALDGGTDGVDVQRRIAAGAIEWLAPGGYLLIETSERQAPQTVAAVAAGRLSPRVVSSAALSATVVIGKKPD
jgi:release factor glutamine methyltransferase